MKRQARLFLTISFLVLIFGVTGDAISGQAGMPLRYAITPHGHSGATDGGTLNLPFYQNTSSSGTFVWVVLGQVKVNDTFIACGMIDFSYSAAPSFPEAIIIKGAGTASVAFYGGTSVYFPMVAISATRYRANTCGIGKVTAAGDLVIQVSYSQGGGTRISEQIYGSVAFIKKQ